MNGPDIADVDAQRELKDCSKHVSKPELVKMLTKMKTQIKYQYVEDLFRHIHSRLETMP